MSDYRIGRLNGRYVVTWWEDGKRKRYRLDALNPKDAEREAIDVIRRDVAQPDTATVKGIWEAYRKEKEGRRVAEAMRHEWKAVGTFFGHLRPDHINVELCRKYTAERRAAGKHDGTIWTELGHLRTALVWAMGRDKAPRMERPPKPRPKDRYLTHAEIGKLLDAPMAHHIRLAILLMLSTAGRVGAILDLTWDRVDMDRGQVNLRSDDSGPRKGRAIVPMNAGLRAALEHAKAGAMSPYVIEWGGQQVKRIKTGFTAAVKASGLEGVSPHVLRHTAAVHLAVAGVPMSRISQYLGHSSTAVTERIYARFSPEHLRDEAEILDFTSVRKVAG